MLHVEILHTHTHTHIHACIAGCNRECCCRNDSGHAGKIFIHTYVCCVRMYMYAAEMIPAVQVIHFNHCRLICNCIKTCCLLHIRCTHAHARTHMHARTCSTYTHKQCPLHHGGLCVHHVHTYIHTGSASSRRLVRALCS
jgi:hypothetical protein